MSATRTIRHLNVHWRDYVTPDVPRNEVASRNDRYGVITEPDIDVLVRAGTASMTTALLMSAAAVSGEAA